MTNFLEMIRFSAVKTFSTERWAGLLLRCMVTTRILTVVESGFDFSFEKVFSFADAVDFFFGSCGLVREFAVVSVG